MPSAPRPFRDARQSGRVGGEVGPRDRPRLVRRRAAPGALVAVLPVPPQENPFRDGAAPFSNVDGVQNLAQRLGAQALMPGRLEAVWHGPVLLDALARLLQGLVRALPRGPLGREHVTPPVVVLALGLGRLGSFPGRIYRALALPGLC